jgi:hypothetical protein
MLIRKIVSLLVFFSISLAVQAQTADEIITKYIAITGGKTAWANIRSAVSSGTYNYGGIEFPFEAWSKAPNLYKYKVSSNGKYFAQAYDGKQGWTIDGFKGEKTKTILEGKAAKAMANEADVELESPFINYKQKGSNITAEGNDTVGNVLCYKIKLIQNATDTSTWFFSTADYSLLKKRAVAKNAELSHGLLDTYYSDYRDVEGIKVPFKTVSKIEDQTVLTVVIHKLQLNVPIANEAFKL